MTPQEINKALAEKVMGWIVAKNPFSTNENDLCLFLKDPNDDSIPFYYVAPIHKLADWDPYTRIDHAWMCLEKCATWTMSKLSNSIICRVIYRYTDGGIGFWSKGEADTASAAICLAALKAVEEKEVHFSLARWKDDDKEIKP